jgi:polyphosphate kinase
MPRNFRRRVELMFPVEDPRLKARLVDGILGIYLSDNVKARVMQPDGSYVRVQLSSPKTPRVRAQVEFQNMAREFSGEDGRRPKPTPTGQPLVFGRPYPT